MNYNQPPQNQPPQGQPPQGNRPEGWQPSQHPANQPSRYPDPHAMMANPNQKNKAPKPKKDNKRYVILGVFLVIGLVLGTLVYSAVNRYTKAMTIIDLPGAPIVNSAGKVEVISTEDPEKPEKEEDVVMSDISVPKGDPWDGKSRVTCLAMGLDYRDWEAGEKYARTDSMMLLTYDPVTERAGMLSIPRDLWVAIPNHDYGRINTAYFLGEAENLPGGGPQLAMETVELLLGIDIQYYAVISFEGFSDFIDSIDKLAIHVKEKITVDPIGPNNTVTLLPGVQDLDGPTALAYARHRYSEGGDFERAQRQQDVIMALYEQLVWQLPQLLGNADQLYASMQKALRTNLTFQDVMKLAWTVVDMEEYQILRSVIAPPYQVQYGKTSDGTQDILIPIPDKIREARDVIFSTSIAASPATIGDDPAQLIAQEQTHITLLNGSSSPDILDRTVQYLQQYGITIDSIGQGNNSYTNTLEIINGKPFTAKCLADIMAIPPNAITLNYQPGNPVDLVVTITDAWVNSNPM